MTQYVPNDNRRIVKGVFGGAAQTFISIVVSVVQIRLVIDFIPKEMAGTWFLFLSIGGYLAFFDLGVGPTLSRLLGFSAGSKTSPEARGQEISDLLATCSKLFLFISLTVFVVACFSGIFFITISVPSEGGRILFAWLTFAAGASLNILGGTAFSALYGLGHVATERLNRAAFQLIGLALAYIALKSGFGIVGLAFAWVFQNLFARISAWWLLFRYHPEIKGLSGKPVRDIIGKIISPSLKWAGMSFGGLLILNSDNILIAFLVGRSAIPPYEAIIKVISAIMLLSMLTVSSSVPFLSKAYSAGDTQLFRNLFHRNLRFGMGGVVIFVSFFSIFGEKVLSVWIGQGNFIGFPVLWVLAAALLLEAHHVIHATVMMAAGHVIFLRTALLAGGLKILLSMYFYRHFGLLGIPTGTFVAQLLTNNWYAPYMAMKTFSIHPRTYAVGIAFPLLVLLVGTIAINGLLLRLTSSFSNIQSLFISLPLSLLASGVIFYAAVIPIEDRLALQKFLGRSRHA